MGEETLQDRSPNDTTLMEIAGTQAEAGDIVGARQTVGQITDRRYLRWAWITIRGHQFRLGDLNGVKETILSFPDDFLWCTGRSERSRRRLNRWG